MHTLKVLEFFLNEPNKPALLLLAFARAVERGTTLYALLALMIFISSRIQDTDLFAKNFLLNMFWFLPGAAFYGLYREINTIYKSKLR